MKDYLELENDLDTPEAEGDRQLTDWNIPEVDVLLGFPHILSLQDLLKLLPSKPDMDRYVATWFNVMEPSRGTFLRKGSANHYLTLRSDCACTYVSAAGEFH